MPVTYKGREEVPFIYSCSKEEIKSLDFPAYVRLETELKEERIRSGGKTYFFNGNPIALDQKGFCWIKEPLRKYQILQEMTGGWVVRFLGENAPPIKYLKDDDGTEHMLTQFYFNAEPAELTRDTLEARLLTAKYNGGNVFMRIENQVCFQSEGKKIQTYFASPTHLTKEEITAIRAKYGSSLKGFDPQIELLADKLYELKWLLKLRLPPEFLEKERINGNEAPSQVDRLLKQYTHAIKVWSNSRKFTQA